ncbi:MAG TPA: SDR family oxidoreductase [Burkholderiaceae bacterium]|nr:SDR family oxidoreductase [Burkholderiaceae bacterium]
MTIANYAQKTIVVTGAGGGLGRALCQEFINVGANIAALDLDGTAVSMLSQELAGSGRMIGIACDVTDQAACEAVMQQVIARFGGIDVLINNAGIAHRSPFGATGVAVIRRVMEVNFFGAVHCTKAALGTLIERRGQIVVISSIAGFSPLSGRTGYSASKHALHGFFDSLRSEIEQDGVGVSIICPSFIATGIDRAALGGDGRPAALPRKTIGAEMTPEDMAKRIFSAVSRRQRLFLPTPLAWFSWWISRLAPGFFARQMKRRVSGGK